MRRLIRRWLGLDPPTQIFVVSDRGVPICACATRDVAQDVCAELSPKTTKVHLVPYKTGEEPWT